MKTLSGKQNRKTKWSWMHGSTSGPIQTTLSWCQYKGKTSNQPSDLTWSRRMCGWQHGPAPTPQSLWNTTDAADAGQGLKVVCKCYIHGCSHSIYPAAVNPCLHQGWQGDKPGATCVCLHVREGQVWLQTCSLHCPGNPPSPAISARSGGLWDQSLDCSPEGAAQCHHPGLLVSLDKGCVEKSPGRRNDDNTHPWSGHLQLHPIRVPVVPS